jgi:hypothetical protein
LDFSFLTLLLLIIGVLIIPLILIPRGIAYLTKEVTSYSKTVYQSATKEVEEVTKMLTKLPVLNDIAASNIVPSIIEENQGFEFIDFIKLDKERQTALKSWGEFLQESFTDEVLHTSLQLEELGERLTYLIEIPRFNLDYVTEDLLQSNNDLYFGKSNRGMRIENNLMFDNQWLENLRWLEELQLD